MKLIDLVIIAVPAMFFVAVSALYVSSISAIKALEIKKLNTISCIPLQNNLNNQSKPVNDPANDTEGNGCAHQTGVLNLQNSDAGSKKKVIKNHSC